MVFRHLPQHPSLRSLKTKNLSEPPRHLSQPETKTLKISYGYYRLSFMPKHQGNLLHDHRRVRKVVQRPLAHNPIQRPKLERQVLTHPLNQSHTRAVLRDMIPGMPYHYIRRFKPDNHRTFLGHLHAINAPAASDIQYRFTLSRIHTLKGNFVHSPK